jgi:putative redox protein
VLITFPGQKKVAVEYKSHRTITDQPEKSGGQDEAPSPLDLFYISIGSCTGYYVLAFCQKRDIPTENIRLELETEKDRQTGNASHIGIRITLPPDFPQQYHEALIKAAGNCKVKKHLENPPKIKITLS